MRTCSVVQGASRSANSENREIHGDRSSNDPYPEGGYFSHHSGQLNSPEADMVTQNYSHMVTGATEEIRHNPHTMTGATEEIPYCSPTTSSGKQKKARSTSQPQLRIVIPSRQLKQTRFCWPFNNWRRTPTQPISTTILAESRNCPNL